MNGFVRVAAAVPKLSVGDTVFNRKEILKLCREAAEKKVKILVFPELSLTGYSCGDLFHQSALIDAAEESLRTILKETAALDMFIALGLPLRFGNSLYNTAVGISGGEIAAVIPKISLPGSESRVFASGAELDAKISLCGQVAPFSSKILFRFDNYKELTVGIEICGDLCLPVPPSGLQAMAGANLILNLAASNELVFKSSARKRLVGGQSEKLNAAYVYASAGMFESSTDMVFSGHSMIFENGEELAESRRFQLEGELIAADVDTERLMQVRRKAAMPSSGDYRFADVFIKDDVNDLQRIVPKLPFLVNHCDLKDLCEEVLALQTAGLAKRLIFTGIKKCVIGISGGLDSTLALLALVKTFDFLGLSRGGIIAVTMPGFGTTERTYMNAVKLINSLTVDFREISIKAACLQHFEDIGHDAGEHDVTYENAQARERTQILMDIANKEAALVIGTGDLSELALGFATYNGDHMSMYGLNAGLPKTLVRAVTLSIADSGFSGEEASAALRDIVATPVSPELLPPDEKGLILQSTEDIVGPYELHDFFLYYLLNFGFSPRKIFFLAAHAFKEDYEQEVILKWMKVFYRRFFSQQFKRSCLPDGPKVFSVSLSPREDWRMPSDASANIWLEEIENLSKW